MHSQLLDWRISFTEEIRELIVRLLPVKEVNRLWKRMSVNSYREILYELRKLLEKFKELVKEGLC